MSGFRNRAGRTRAYQRPIWYHSTAVQLTLAVHYWNICQLQSS